MTGGRQHVAVSIATGISIATVLAIIGTVARGDEAGGRHKGIDTELMRPPAAVATVPAPPPMDFVQLPIDAALASNAALPFSREPIVAEPSFRYVGTSEDKAAALTCLAAAAIYEAGDDAPGEKAVAQVILNRLRHPAFPKTVCGVVFQGAERTTGCQFTFTCDGALARPLQPDAWRRATEIAAAALAGKVDATVGTATHYHTDWVVPYWRDSLVKLAKVHTQIFYRWAGWWGTRAAFTGRLVPGERLDPAVAAILSRQVELPPGAIRSADATIDEPVAVRRDELGPGLDVIGVPAEALRGNLVRAMDRAQAEFVLELDPKAFPGGYALVSLTLCGTADRCTVMGWLPGAAVPTSLPVSAQAMNSVAFVYTRSRAQNVEQARWDCRRIRRDDNRQCLSRSGDVASD